MILQSKTGTRKQLTLPLFQLLLIIEQLSELGIALQHQEAMKDF